MFEPVENFYTDVIQAQVRRINWHGSIKDSLGIVHSFSAENIEAGSGTILREAFSGSVALGTVNAAELKIGLFLDDIGVDPDYIYGARIILNCLISAGESTQNVQLGAFYVTEATQKGKVCSITAYDAMLNFNIYYGSVSGVATPFNWALSFCEKCGVTLGMTQTQIQALPNGTTSLTLVWNDDIETYRDALSHLAAAVGSIATINRFGELVLIPLKTIPVSAVLSASDRFNSDIAHITYMPHTVSVTNEETGELTKVEATYGSGVIDLETNAFLQLDGKIKSISGAVTDTRTVEQMLQQIMLYSSTFSSVPFEAEIPCDPCLELLDRISLFGGQAAPEGTDAFISSIEIKIGGATKIKCAGASTAENKTAEQRANSNAGGADRNLLMWQSTDSNDSPIYLSSIEQMIVSASIVPLKEWAKGQMNFTVNFTLDESATVTYTVYVDDVVNWQLTETLSAGKVVKTITTFLDFWSNTEQAHTVKVAMKEEATA